MHFLKDSDTVTKTSNKNDVYNMGDFNKVKKKRDQQKHRLSNFRYKTTEHNSKGE